MVRIRDQAFSFIAIVMVVSVRRQIQILVIRGLIRLMYHSKTIDLVFHDRQIYC